MSWAEIRSRLYVCCESYKKSKLPIETLHETAYIGMGISPGKVGGKYLLNSVLFNFCANVLWASCEWEIKHDDVKKKKKHQNHKKRKTCHSPPQKKPTKNTPKKTQTHTTWT